MTRDQALSRTSSIKHAVSSANTCSEATIEGLKHLLESKPSQKDTTNAVTTKTKAGKTPIPLAGPTRPIAKRSKLRSVIAVVEVHQDAEEYLEARDKIKLATEVVNAALKGLTDATKSPTPPKLQRERVSLSRTPSNQLIQCSAPLRIRCVNQSTGAPHTSNGVCSSRRSSSTSCVGPDQGVVALATCAREALAFLRRCSSDTKTLTWLSPIQVDSGMSALINKLISLGLDDLATKELRLLLKRLGGGKGDHTTKGSDSIPKQQTLSDLLIVKEVPRDPARLALLVTSQLQVLRLISAKRRPAAIEAVLEHLKLVNPCSPVSLIQHASSKGTPATCEKAARQLESLAQVLQSIAKPLLGQDLQVSNSRTFISPHVAVEYQLLILEIRIIWWRMLGHCVDIKKELLASFSSTILAFNQKSVWSPMKKHDYCSNACARFLDLLEGQNQDQPDSGEFQSMKCDIFQIIADSARNASRVNDALKYLGKCLELLKISGRSQTSIHAMLCQILSVQLKFKTGLEESASSHLDSLVNALRGNLSGESAELDDFLLRAVQLQRLVLTALLGDTMAESHNDTVDSLEKLRDTGFTYILECSLFLKRYLGKPSDSTVNIRQRDRYLERKLLVTRMAIPAVESIAGLARTVSVFDIEKWRRLDSTISICTSLMIECENSEQPTSVPTSSQQTTQTNWRQLISSVYWSRFLGLKQQSASSDEMLKSLLTSISLLDGFSTSEQFQSQICTRLDRLGALFESQSRWTEAKATYSKSLNTQIAAKCMAHAATSMSKKPLNVILQDQDLAMWNRTILAFSHSLLRADGKEEPSHMYDSKDAPRSLRGMILEQQLAVVESTWLGVASAQALKSVLNYLAHSLLDCYGPSRYPIRRMRVSLVLLRMELTVPEVLTEGTREEILQGPLPSLLENFEEDADLSRYACHLIASIELVRNFLGKHPSGATCQKVLNTWKSMIKSSDPFMENVDDMPRWVKQLRMLAEYFGLQGLEVERAETLHLCSIVQEYEPKISVNDKAICQMDLCFQLLELGYSEKASLLLQRVRKQVTTLDLDHFSKFQWHLVSAAHGLAVGSQSECQSHISKASSILAQDPVDRNPSTSVTTKLTQVLQRASHSHVQAAGLFSRGSTGEAIFHARWSVKLSYRAWALLEYKVNKQRIAKKAHIEIEMDSMTDNIASLSTTDSKQPIVSSTKHESLNGSAFWSLVPILVRRLLFLASLFEYSGLVSEAQYYIDQATKIADAVKGPSLRSQCLASVGILALRRSKIPDALESLRMSVDEASWNQTTIFHARLHIGLHEVYVLEQNWEKASCSLRDAESAMERVEAWTTTASSIFKNDVQERLLGTGDRLASRPETLTLASKRQDLIVKKVVQKTSTRARKAEIVPATTSSDEQEQTGDAFFQRLRGTIKRRHAFQALLQKQLQPATAILSEAAKFPQGPDETARQYIWQAQAHLSQGFAELTLSSVFCVLHDSSISYPSIVQITVQGQGGAHVASSPTKMVKGTKIVTKTLAKRSARKSTEASAAFCNFSQSFEKLKHLVLQGPVHASSRSLHAISDRLIKSSLMLSATSHVCSPLGLNPIFALYSLELGRCSSAAQEISAAKAERLVAQGDIATASGAGKHEEMLSSMSCISLDYTTFQKDYIDIIPKTWTVISISLNETRDEIHLSKLCSGEAPFIVMIPLNRHNSRDADEEVFGFDQCKAELTNIIDLANYSTHDERDFSKKGAKTEWWEARAALDARLKDLLVNIENIWLGGFRGLLGQQHRHPHLLARFKQSFDKILDTHLPSRRRTGRVAKNTSAARVELDPHVLELVIGLGNPSELKDLDEPLLDLLYFVIDVLQFHGERNAYDEIDFDSIIVETLDALRQYHLVLFQESHDETQIHTILILDKTVHAFPWESLPCLVGRPVTRLPSLVHLRSRILDMRKQSAGLGNEEPTGPRIDSQSTSYILNPSADLAATESTFFPYVTSLPNTSTNPTQIIHRAPTSSEFQAALSSSSLLLYFGHGSGGQYIRSRTIQKLDHCAVALLLGCSSATLIEEGEYEPHGVVNSYLVAGAPAVIGTLWDVTDKDIDRWSLDCLERWGLFEEKKTPILESPTKKSRGKGKARVLENGMTPGRMKSRPRTLEENGDAQGLRGVEARGKVSLDHAVALAREKCLMKYLNGAAPVVYGIPVYLS